MHTYIDSYGGCVRFLLLYLCSDDVRVSERMERDWIVSDTGLRLRDTRGRVIAFPIALVLFYITLHLYRSEAYEDHVLELMPKTHFHFQDI